VDDEDSGDSAVDGDCSPGFPDLLSEDGICSEGRSDCGTGVFEFKTAVHPVELRCLSNHRKHLDE
jgi:hypothetical protein